MRDWIVAVTVLVTFLVSSQGIGAAGPKASANISRWELFEISISNPREYANPFTDVNLEATFTSPSGKNVKAGGFYDGEKTWRLRFGWLLRKHSAAALPKPGPQDPLPGPGGACNGPRFRPEGTARCRRDRRLELRHELPRLPVG